MTLTGTALFPTADQRATAADQRLDAARRVLGAGGMVLVIGGYFSGKTALARVLAPVSGPAALIDLEPHLDDLGALPDGPLVVTCWIGTGDHHEATAGTCMRVAAHRLPDYLLHTRQLPDGTTAVVGGGYMTGRP